MSSGKRKRNDKDTNPVPLSKDLLELLDQVNELIHRERIELVFCDNCHKICPESPIYAHMSTLIEEQQRAYCSGCVTYCLTHNCYFPPWMESRHCECEIGEHPSDVMETFD